MGNYRNFLASGGAYRSRMAVAKEVVANLIHANHNDVNFGLMAFNTAYAVGPNDEWKYKNVSWYGNGGFIIAECGADIAALIGGYEPGDTMDHKAQTGFGAVGSLGCDTNTPLAETLAEAGLYFAGKQSWFNGAATGEGYPLGQYTFDCTEKDSGCQNYNSSSPIKWRCQKNYIILVTDGEPTRDDNKFATTNYIIDKKVTKSDQGDNTSYLDDVAEFLNQNDILPLPSSPTEVDKLRMGVAGDFEDQTITTYTVGFKLDVPLLGETAKRGGGKYYTADSAAELGESLTNIITAIGENNEMFTAAAIPISSENGVFAGNYIYLGLFQPTNYGSWLGNIKKFGFSNGEVYDKQGNKAASDKGLIFSNSISYWSTAADGADVTAGGAGEILRNRSAARNILTYTGSNSDLADATNHFTAANTTLSTYPSLTEEVIAAVHTGAAHDWPLGSVLHFQPTVEHYDINDDGINDKTAIFAGANDGMLHCFDDDTGEELWAFIPQDLLQNVSSLLNAESLNYFVDGNSTTYRYDHDNDPATAAKKIILFGERRGGHGYTALDVSNYAAPKFKYSISADHLGEEQEALGQSWGEPELCRMGYMDGSTYKTKEAFLLPGGYDINQDAESPAAADSVGRAVFGIDAQTGVLLDSFGFNNANYSEMTHSIIAMSAFENPLTSTTTRVYAGDMDGNLFAFRDDIFHRNRSAAKKTDFDGLYDGQEDGNWEQKLKLFSTPGKKIWYAPNIVNEYFPVKFPAVETGTGIAEERIENRAGDYVFFGTGDRSRPNEIDTMNAFYAIKNNWQWESNTPAIVEAYVDEEDGGKIKAKNDGRVIVEQQRADGNFAKVTATERFILDVTDDLIQNQEDEQQIRTLYSQYVKDALSHPENRGWYINFVKDDGSASGEKLVSSPRIYQGIVMFTTFVPEPDAADGPSTSDDPCSAPQSRGTGYFYALDYQTGAAVFNFDLGNDGSGEGTGGVVVAKSDRRYKLTTPGIPPAPSIIVSESGTTILVGLETIPVQLKEMVERLFWRQLHRD
ncbi:MAG: PilC/PilY family type IV pilus protein [Desulfuromonadaceae bacterium]|nr:PilC/PilY family type IV pilus protein [Desulfuromonadaceae bacterium]